MNGSGSQQLMWASSYFSKRTPQLFLSKMRTFQSKYASTPKYLCGREPLPLLKAARCPLTEDLDA
ncbi:hypothetical protein GCM10025779_15410 [Arthrobacter cryoconiti]